MFRRTIQSQLRFKPIRQLRFTRQISTDINNGQKGLPTWPNKEAFFSVYAKEGRALVGWFVALTGIMLWGPLAIVELSDSIDHVPKDKGAQVQLHRIEGTIDKYEADVEIPQTFVSLDKLDEEEGEDVTVDDEE